MTDDIKPAMIGDVCVGVLRDNKLVYTFKNRYRLKDGLWYQEEPSSLIKTMIESWRDMMEEVFYRTFGLYIEWKEDDKQ